MTEKLGLCQKCGVDMDLVGLRHRCRPMIGPVQAASPVTKRDNPSRPVTEPVTKRDTGRRCPTCGASGWAGPKSAADRQRARRARKSLPR